MALCYNYGASKTTLLRSAPQFANPLAYGGEACVMRTSMVCCARTPNIEIAFFSGDFVTEGSTLPWRCQERVNAGEVKW